MKRTLLLGVGLFFLFSSSAYGTMKSGRLDRDSRLQYKSGRIERYGRIYYKLRSVVRGKRGRKYARRFSLRENLTGDKLRIYEAHGYTPHRLGYNFAGRRTERWKYYSLGVEYVFDDESNLIATRYFLPEGNHID